MHTIITFLGKYPKETQYAWNGQIYQGEVFAQALRQFCHYDRMLVFATAEAHQTSWPVLEKLADERIEEVEIPIGENVGDIWQIFDQIIDRVDFGETVTFDITHGLRSIPFLVFLFAAYLKTAKQVTIQAIYYGAFELGDSNRGLPAPVIDLSAFASMLDWIAATDQFVQTGDARRLAGLLDAPGKGRPASRQAASSLSAVSQAAFLCQPFTLMEQAGKLGEALKKAEMDFSTSAHPFGVLSQQITAAFEDFSAPPEMETAAKLKAMYKMIEWYFDHGQVIQALSLAREWLIDAVTYRLKLPLDYSRTPRNLMEYAVSGQSRIGREIRDESTQEFRRFTVHDLNEYGRIIYNTWPEQQRLAKLWDTLSSVRNGLDHAEHQKNPLVLKSISKKAQEIQTELNKLAAEWGMIAEGTR